MIGGVIGNMEKHLPYNEDLIFFWYFYRFGEQHIVLQFGKVRADGLLHFVPVRADGISIVSVNSLRKRLQRLSTAQFTEPHVFRVKEMNDLLPHRPTRVIHRLRELFKGKRSNTVPHLAVLREVIVVEMAKSICIHFEITPLFEASYHFLLSTHHRATTRLSN